MLKTMFKTFKIPIDMPITSMLKDVEKNQDLQNNEIYCESADDFCCLEQLCLSRLSFIMKQNMQNSRKSAD